MSTRITAEEAAAITAAEEAAANEAAAEEAAAEEAARRPRKHYSTIIAVATTAAYVRAFDLEHRGRYALEALRRARLLDQIANTAAAVPPPPPPASPRPPAAADFTVAIPYRGFEIRFENLYGYRIHETTATPKRLRTADTLNGQSPSPRPVMRTASMTAAKEAIRRKCETGSFDLRRGDLIDCRDVHAVRARSYIAGRPLESFVDPLEAIRGDLHRGIKYRRRGELAYDHYRRIGALIDYAIVTADRVAEAGGDGSPPAGGRGSQLANHLSDNDSSDQIGGIMMDREFKCTVSGITLEASGGNARLLYDGRPADLYDLIGLCAEAADSAEEFCDCDWCNAADMAYCDYDSTYGDYRRAIGTVKRGGTAAVMTAAMHRATRAAAYLIEASITGSDLRHLGNLESALHAAAAVIEESVSLDRDWNRRTAGYLEAAIEEEAKATDFAGIDMPTEIDVDDVIALTLPPIAGGSDPLATIRAAARAVRGLEIDDHDPIEIAVLAAAAGDATAAAAIRRKRIADRLERSAGRRIRYSSGRRPRPSSREDRRRIRKQLRDADSSDLETLEALGIPPIRGGSDTPYADFASFEIRAAAALEAVGPPVVCDTCGRPQYDHEDSPLIPYVATADSDPEDEDPFTICAYCGSSHGGEYGDVDCLYCGLECVCDEDSGGLEAAAVCERCNRPAADCVNPDRRDLYVVAYVYEAGYHCLNCVPDCMTLEAAVDREGNAVGILDIFEAGDTAYECDVCGRGNAVPPSCDDCLSPLIDLEAGDDCEYCSN